MAIKYDIRTAWDHELGKMQHGWSYQDHEKAMLREAGEDGWILCAIKHTPQDDRTRYYFYKECLNSL